MKCRCSPYQPVEWLNGFPITVQQQWIEEACYSRLRNTNQHNNRWVSSCRAPLWGISSREDATTADMNITTALGPQGD